MLDVLTAHRRRAHVALALLTAATTTALAGAPPAGAQGKPSKVASIVEQLAADTAADRRAGRSPARRSNDIVKVDAGGAIEVSVWAASQVGSRERAQLTRLGARIIATAGKAARRGRPAFGLFHAAVPHDRLDDAAALAWVGAITTPGYGYGDDHPNNPVLSQGVALHRADDVQARGVDGTGVTVGVISTGVPSLAAGDVPAVTVNNVGCPASASGVCDEGVAMLEIVHDMAPGAGLMFDAGPGGGAAGHVNAQDWLAANGADVITEDLAFDDQPVFQYGELAAHGDQIAAGGVSLHSSAGNLGNAHAAQATATGSGQGPDGNTGPCAGSEPDNAVAIAGGADNTFDITVPGPAANRGSLTLQWSEPRAIAPTVGRGGFTNLDLYVLDATGANCITQMTGPQAAGVGDTIEQIGGLVPGTYKVVVDVENAPAGVAVPTLDLRMRNVNATDPTARPSSVNPDSNYMGPATSAAAVNATSAALEGFSAGGPIRLLTTTQCPGGAAGPCGAGVAGTLDQSLFAPTWAAADGVAVTGAGGFSNPFFGTSAAAPHAAACDALLRDETNQPSAAPAVTNARLAATAVDMGFPGVDMSTGAGRLDCLLAVNDPPTADAGGPYATQEGTDVTVSAAGSSDPDTNDTLTYAWDLDGDGAFDDATGVSATFTDVGRDGSFTVRVRATDTADATATDSATVGVANVAPAVGAIATDAPKAESAAVSISGTITDPGFDDPLGATIDFGDGAGPQALVGDEEDDRPDATIGYDIDHVYGDDGTFTIEVCAADDDVSDICRTAQATVTNVAPTAAIGEDDATDVNGTPVLIAQAGETVDVAGRSTDPGSDDLTLWWDWDDGGPAIDLSTTYLVNPPSEDPDPSPSVQPRDVTDAVSHAFGQACTYDIVFSASDDDGGGSASDTIKVLITGNADEGQPSGYWAHQYRQRGAIDFDDVTLECYLEIAGFVSSVFHEVRDVATFKRAQALLFSQGKLVTKLDQLDRDVLTAWLNFANGAVGWDELVDTDANGTADTPLREALQTAESVRVNPAATPAQLDAQRTRVQSINDSI